MPFLQHHVSPGFPQAPPFTAWSGPDEDVRRQQEDIYIYGSKYVEWLKVINVLTEEAMLGKGGLCMHVHSLKFKACHFVFSQGLRVAVKV